MKKDMAGILIATIVAALLAGCTTPRVVNFPDGSQTVKVKGRSVHVRTVMIDGKKYILKINGAHGSSLHPFDETKSCD